jgi:hypothetical protein
MFGPRLCPTYFAAHLIPLVPLLAPRAGACAQFSGMF